MARPKHPKPDSNHASIKAAIPETYNAWGVEVEVEVLDTHKFGEPYLDLIVMVGPIVGWVEIKPPGKPKFQEYEIETIARWNGRGQHVAVWQEPEDIERSLELWTQ